MNIFTTRSKSQKLRKAFFSAFLIVSLVLSQAALPLTLAYATNKIDICHKEGNSWKFMDTPNESSLGGHLGHGDFLFNSAWGEGSDQKCIDHAPVPPVDVCPNIDGNQAAVPQGKQLVQGQCVDIVTETPTATISATKVVCDTEADLPNWGGGGHTISATTASEFVASKPNKCHLQSGWGFEWGVNAPDGGNATIGHVDGYTAFPTTTNGSGVTTTTVPVGQGEIHLREVLQSGYVPFSGQNTTEDVSAEFYCTGDTLNYDNWDFIRNPEAGASYDCVGFNAPVTPPLQCNPAVNLIENGDFETPALSTGTWDIIPSSNTLLKWLVAFISPAAGRLGLEIQNHVAGDPALGAQHAELDGDNPVTIWQDIPTIAGKQYSLSFKYSPRPGVAQADNAIQPKLNNAVLGAVVSADGTANANTVWQTITRTFIGTGSPMKVELADAGSDTSLGGYLDDVKLNCVGDPAPQCNAAASADIVSNSSTKVGAADSAELSFIHPAWTTISGAKWIWATNPVESPTNDADLTKVFTKTFTIVGTPTGGSLQVAADNNYTFKVNGTTVPVVFDQDNFSAVDTYNVLPLLVTGVNTLEFTVTNWEVGQPDADPAANPAGLIYKLSLTNNECVTPPVGPSTSTVTMCKQDADIPVGNTGNHYPMPGWTLTLKGASVGSVDVLPTGADFKIAGVPAGDYILNAIGKYTYRGTPGAEFSDAAYSQRDPGDAVYQTAALNPIQSSFLPWVRENDFPTPNTGWLGVMYNNAPTNWGSIFNNSHDYVLGTSTASLGDMSFKILDDQYGDNSGKITVNAAHGYVGVTQGFDSGTPGPGCVSFSNVPYGTYTAGEIMQSGWENVSGLGSVVVDSPTEKFVILNRHIAPPAPTDGKVHIFKFINGEQATALSADSVAFPMKTATYGNAQFFLRPSGWDNAGDVPYEASTSTIAAGGTYTANEDLEYSPALVGASCDSQSRPAYELVGYSTGSTLEAAKTATKTLTAPTLTVNGDQYMIVWNHKCGSVLGASTLKVHLYKYLKDGNTIAQVPNDSSAPEFPMTATWQTANLNGGVSSSAPYVLGNYHGGTSLKYAADTAPMEAPANYTSSEVTSVESNFLPIGAQCVPGKYRLVGYKSSIDSLATAEGMPTLSTAPQFVNLNDDAYVIVVNEKCADLPPPPATGSIEITKYTCPANFVPNRTSNGVGSVVPEGCTLTAGTAFGYVHGDATDANGPYPELDATPTPGGVTAGNGKLVIGPVLSAGRYLIKETDATNLAGLYCQGDGDTNPNNNDNQELTFVPANGVTKCVAYNKAPQGDGEGEDTSETITVKPSALHNWMIWNADAVDSSDQDDVETVSGTDGTFVTGPAPTPLGTGSFKQVIGTNGNDADRLVTSQLNGTPLANITQLAYSTFVSNYISGQATYVQIRVDTNNDGDWDDALFFEPVYQTGTYGMQPGEGSIPNQCGVSLNCVDLNTWQTWNLKTGGWWTNSDAAGGPPLRTLAKYIADHPGVKLATNVPAIRLQTGFGAGAWDNFVGNFDKFVIGVQTGSNVHTTTFDFEPEPVVTTICSDGLDNDQDGLIDANDPGCHSDGNASNSESYVASDTDETNPAPQTFSRGGGGGGGGMILPAAPKGSVLGASTQCGLYLDDFLKMGKKNNKDEVKKLQTFLNDYLKLSPKISVNGIFGIQTYKAVLKFQEQESDYILKPWVGITLKTAAKGTGWVYKTTVTRINNIMCPELNLQTPPLTID